MDPQLPSHGAEGATAPVSLDERELFFSRVVPLPAKSLYRAWTEPLLLLQWFAPAPRQVIHVDLNVRPGGTYCIVTRGPDAREHPHRGLYLEVVPRRRLVFTDAYVAPWVPSANPSLTTVLTFEELDPVQTRYTARLLHWTIADRETHERRGVQEDWGRRTDQLVALAQKL